MDIITIQNDCLCIVFKNIDATDILNILQCNKELRNKIYQYYSNKSIKIVKSHCKKVKIYEYKYGNHLHRFDGPAYCINTANYISWEYHVNGVRTHVKSNNALNGLHRLSVTYIDKYISIRATYKTKTIIYTTELNNISYSTIEEVKALNSYNILIRNDRYF